MNIKITKSVDITFEMGYMKINKFKSNKGVSEKNNIYLHIYVVER